MTVRNLEDDIREIREILIKDFKLLEGPLEDDEREIILHRLKGPLFVTCHYLPNDGPLTYEDLRLKLMGHLFDPKNENNPGVQRIREELYIHFDESLCP